MYNVQGIYLWWFYLLFNYLLHHRLLLHLHKGVGKKNHGIVAATYLDRPVVFIETMLQHFNGFFVKGGKFLHISHNSCHFSLCSDGEANILMVIAQVLLLHLESAPV